MSEESEVLISVIIPSRNRREILSRCLESLANQTIDDYEVIVVDDNSDDDTPDYLARFEGLYPDLKFRWFRNEPHIGANPSRNRGVKAAVGRYIAFTDDDCIATPDWLEKLAAGFVNDNVSTVTGYIDDVIQNYWELTFKGTHLVWSPDGSAATRLVGGNMAMRRDILLAHMLDEDASEDTSKYGRCDEEGLFLILKAKGYEQRVAPDAKVTHDHRYTFRSLSRQAYRGGMSAAKLVHKYHLRHRTDMIPFLLGYVTLPLGLINVYLLAVPLFFLSGALAAITYNDLFRKKKKPGETLYTYPMLLLYYHLRLIGYTTQTLRLLLGKDKLKRVDLREAANA